MPHTATLKPKEERRLLRGHRWAYRNEFAALPNAEDGALVDVRTDGGRFLGRGFFQAAGGIAVRLLTLEDKPVDAALLRARIHRARRYREQRFGDSTVYRWVHAESDGLPGFVADRYDRVVSVQAASVFYAQHAKAIAAAFLEVPGVAGVRFETSGHVTHFGEALSPVELAMNDVRFLVDVDRGQKTGMFLDQRENVLLLRNLARDARIMDGHCYTGLWGVSAACWGAKQVIGVDTSAAALDLARQNARLNQVEERCHFQCRDVRDTLLEDGPFDVILLDPPALAKTRGQMRKALGAYLALNRLAMEALAPEGWLITSSCSHFVGADVFLETLTRAARAARRDLWLVEMRGAASDHPVSIAMPETAYLTCVALRLL
ncbi:MAG: class I SAM-dependent rRNA methyltransferase [Candidatus Hydrogenedentales bacterium]|jgi:23S rRNA (cytosine1962-C5)-methyltransferase